MINFKHMLGVKLWWVWKGREQHEIHFLNKIYIQKSPTHLASSKTNHVFIIIIINLVINNCIAQPNYNYKQQQRWQF